MFKNNINLLNENKNLKLQIMTFKDEIKQIKNMYNLQSEKMQSMSKLADKICKLMVSESYAKQQLNNSGKKISGEELFKLAIENYNLQNLKSRNLLIELTNTIKDKDLEIEGLKAQISTLLMQQKRLSMLNENKDENFFNPEIDDFIECNKEEKKQDNVVVKTIIDENLNIQNDETNDINKKNTTNKNHTPQLTTNFRNIQVEEIKAIPMENKNFNNNNKPINKFNNNFKNKNNNYNKFDKNSNFKNNNKPINKFNNNFKKNEPINTKKNLKTTTSFNNIKNKENSNINFNNDIKFKENNNMNMNSKNSDILPHVINLKDCINQCDEVMWHIIELIGKDGLSIGKDIKDRVVNPNVTVPAYNTALNNLRKMNLLESEKINTGWRWFYAYELSELGVSLFFDKYKKNPIICEKQQIKKDHTSALHGYCIKDTLYLLKSILGYDNATMDRTTNSMTLHDGRTYIPDIIATKKERGIIDYFEVELGHHTQKDFNIKCDKMRMVTQNLYFIVPDASTMNKILERQIAKWVVEKGGKDKLKGVNIYLTTLTKLASAKWEKEYKF